ncbi:hypothetical protein FE257_006396 [Aspergillus nanangensis]|uniref:DUF521 domain protein n=1 Tax=Aspergillus nanangensis TaxID=2582783 RepID=A0AAD4CZC3_ASPNN|nr:hypothetical protein FE257_006396 [Aspergillus nanangensis]
MDHLQGHCLVSGTATAKLLCTSIGLSFWGGVDPRTGQVVDHHHPLHGQSLAGQILAIPCGRGSCSGSTVMLELLLSDCAPAALIFEQPEQILTLGVLVGQALFQRSIPVVVLSPSDFQHLQSNKPPPFAAITGGNIHLSDHLLPIPTPPPLLPPTASLTAATITLSPTDQHILAGSNGPAAQTALEILLRFAASQGAPHLLSVTQSHIDACIYTGPASLRFAQTFHAMGAKFVLPTTLNSISIDRRRWQELGVDSELASQAGELANLYLAMGATPSFTCAPYTLASAPGVGENVGWSESNAVVFANSVLGAKTQKYPDFIDVCIALTGRAPSAGCHLPEGRRPGVCIDVAAGVLIGGPPGVNEAIYPLLGYAVGKIAQHRVPLVCGMEEAAPSRADLKAFSAAFGTTASAAMFHVKGVTPEAAQFGALETQLERVALTRETLRDCWEALNSARDRSVGLVSLGNPHFAVEEFAALAVLCAHRRKSDAVEVIITTSRATFDEAHAAGYLVSVEAFGARIITDTCWCMIGEPVIPSSVRNLMTNSAKYAHYAPGMVNRGVHFGSLAQCVEAACSD